jgi:hypothetical protein
MKIKNLEKAAETIKRYENVSGFLEEIIKENDEYVSIFFGVSSSSVFIDIPSDTAETLLCNEKHRLERELAGLGVEL